MKILSTFDLSQKNKLLNKEIKKHWERNAFLLQKSKIFYIMYVLFPLFGLFAAALLWLLLRIMVIAPEHNNIFNRGYLLLLAMVSVSIVLPLLKKYFDYHMDFLIITPEYIVNYNQEWFFQRDIVSLNIKNIKTVSVKKAGIFNSLFNEGSLEILCEGDDAGRLNVDYVTWPERIKNKINKILTQASVNYSTY